VVRPIELNIICADDKFFNLEDMRIIFSKLDLVDRCLFVNNGKEAVDAYFHVLEKNTFDKAEQTILFLDYDMPNMTGIEVINELQAYYLVNKQRLLNAAKLFSEDENGGKAIMRPIQKPTFVICSAFSSQPF
jgi:CheY-like chemotaxis protein